MAEEGARILRAILYTILNYFWTMIPIGSASFPYGQAPRTGRSAGPKRYATRNIGRGVVIHVVSWSHGCAE